MDEFLPKIIHSVIFLLLMSIAGVAEAIFNMRRLKKRYNFLRRLSTLEDQLDRPFVRHFETSEGRAASFIGQLISLIIQFSAFCTLTHHFPVFLVAAAAILFVLSEVWRNLMGAMTGLSLPEREGRLFRLNLLDSHNSWQVHAGNILILLAGFASIAGTLIVYWQYPIGEVQALPWIASFQFGFFWTAIVAIRSFAYWHLMTSEFLDNDLRDNRLQEAFSNAVKASIYLVYPYLLVQTESENWMSSFFAVWIAVPIIVFLISDMVPFFIGMYRHRERNKQMAEWRRKWLAEELAIMKLPRDLGHRVQKLKKYSEELDSEIESLEIKIRERDGRLQEEDDKEAKEVLKEWDLRQRHLDELLAWRNILQITNDESIEKYFEARLKEAERRTDQAKKESSNVGAVLSGVLAATLLWCFGVFEDDIKSCLRKLTGTEKIIEQIQTETIEDSGVTHLLLPY